MEGWDEIRIWKNDDWEPLVNQAYFYGQVLAVTTNSVNNDEFIVGGNFTQILINGNAYNYSYLVTFDSKVYHSHTNYLFVGR